MKKNDVALSLVAGVAIAVIAYDFLGALRVPGVYEWPLLILLIVLCPLCLWLAEVMGRNMAFVLQAAKYVLSGAFADVIDIKFFQFLILVLPFNAVIFKVISFLVATFVKYGMNKYWAFEKNNKDGMKKEAAYFIIITLIGLVFDVAIFYYLTKVLGPEFSMNGKIWKEFSIIVAALVTAVWNFLGYKFIVFKK